MYLSKFRLLNYKSFRDSGTLEFKPGINIIVGTNNSGKTALLEALSLSFQNHIHKSMKTFPFPSDVIDSYSGYQLSLNVEKADIQLFLDELAKSYQNPIIPIPEHYKQAFSGDSSKYYPRCIEFLKSFLRDKTSKKDIEIQIRARGSGDVIPFDSVPDFFSSFYKNTSVKTLLKEKELNVLEATYGGVVPESNNNQISGRVGLLRDTVQYQFFQKYRKIIYKFNAERLSSGTSPAGISPLLEPDASNLAAVLLNLQGNRDHFELFNNYVSTVIPSIKWVSVLPYNGITFQIKVWTLETVEKRVDLAYPLSDCGTGVSQVLALLYVITFSEEPQIIIIDEPQSFLHPGAAKKLIEILKKFPQHQYFIATHSADIIAAANPSTIVKLRYEDGETQASTMNSGDIKEQRSLLAELGVSLSDVFGADSILWVEGWIEEQCFPRILSKRAPELLTGTKIISVKQTGDLLGKKAHFADVMFDLYRRLSGGNNLSPPVLGFVFDKENRTKQDMEDLRKRSSEPVYFLKKCMYENYLLHPDAIAAVLNKYNPEPEHALTSEVVREKLEINKEKLKEKLKEKKDSFPKNTTREDESDTQDVEANIDAAKLLNTLFTELSFTPVKFEKNPHSIMLTEWLLENEPDHFVELVEFLRGILGAGTATVF